MQNDVWKGQSIEWEASLGFHSSAGGKTQLLVVAAEFADDRADEGFCVAEEHERAVKIVERIIDARKTCGHAALDDHHGARLVDVQNRHAVDWTAGIGARGGVSDVSPANHQRHLGPQKISLYFVHVQEFIVKNVRFPQPNVHLPPHAATHA